MNVLIIGSGGREHALAWKIAQSNKVAKVFVAPGNAGTALEPKIQNISINPMSFSELISFAKDNEVSFTVVGPETPLSNGIVDEFTSAGLDCFGANKQAAQLEASKAFSKDFMLRHHIPTAHYQTFTDISTAKAYTAQENLPLVIKADGLAAGKGVVIAHKLDEAYAAIEKMLQKKSAAETPKIVIEEFLSGEEASFIVMVADGQVLPLATSQDHKTRDDGDEGPNTGGMGAYSPTSLITETLKQRILEEIIHPTIRGLAAENISYQGFLYAGLMITTKGEIKVLEFNCRLGDPETQVILPRLQSDLVTVIQAAFQHRLNEISLQWDPRVAVGVVLSAAGYPDNPQQGDLITGLNSTNGSNHKIFHAGTLQDSSGILTHGGRVLCVTALGTTIKEAACIAYDKIKKIHWSGMFYRTDIGYKEIFRTTSL